MRVAPGTNVILSGAILAYPTIGAALDDMAKHHELALSTYVIEGLREVVARKWPARAHALEGLLQSLTYELVMTPLEPKGGLFDICGPKGYPVPCSAMLAGADVLVTSDKDFDAVKVDSPEILTPAEYVERYVNTA